MTMTAADKNRRIFDARFRRATIANDDFDQSLRIIAGAYQSGEIPADWGVQVRQTMAHIRKAKTLLTKAISDADPIVQDKSVGPDEIVEIHRSVGYLNGRLQRVIAVEESLLNSLLAGDADYTAMYLDAQRVQQSFEERIHQEAYGDYEDPEDFASDDDGYEDPEDVQDEEIPEEDQTEDPEDVSEDSEPEDSAEESAEPVDDDVPEDDNDDSEEESDDESPTEPVVEDAAPAEPESYTDDVVDEDYSEPEPVSEPEPETESDIDPEAPIIMSVPQDEEPQVEPLFEPEPVRNPIDELTTEDKVRMILSDPDIQAVIRDAAHRQALAEIEAMRSGAIPGPETTEPAPVPEQTSVMERPEPRVVVTTRGEDIPASEFPGSTDTQSEPRRGLVGRIRAPKTDKQKPRKNNRRSRRNAGGEQ